jgi:glucose-1-phosphate adenylyltransferase
MPSQTLTLLLAGGQGSRLFPLTRDRAKPAVPFGGKYRVIDFTLSNCLHSGLRQILVLTQYKSQSLQRHLRDGWSIFSPECGEFITMVPPQMRNSDSWYEGTADALHQNLYLLERNPSQDALILAADHIYRMDYAAMIQAHRETGADLTIACMKVPLSEASAFGVMGIDAESRIVEFKEKPQKPTPIPGESDAALVSMGIYVYKKDVLIDALERDHGLENSSHDFGHDLIPSMIETGRVFAYAFGGERGRVMSDHYWRDVGTIDAYYDANMDLLKPVPPLNLYQENWGIRTYHGQNPPARMVPGGSGDQGLLLDSILGAGALISGAHVQRSILSARVRVMEGACVEDSILFDQVSVGEGAVLRRCIIDKGVNIPPGTLIGVDIEQDRKRFTVSDHGIIVVPRLYSFESSPCTQ